MDTVRDHPTASTLLTLTIHTLDADDAAFVQEYEATVDATPNIARLRIRSVACIGLTVADGYTTM